MKLLTKTINQLDWLTTSLLFVKKHLLVISTLGLVAGVGRVIQLGGFGAISSSTHIVLEIIIESARVFLFLYVLGLSDIGKGLSRIKTFFVSNETRRSSVNAARHNLRKNWLGIILNLVAFSLIAVAINYVINLLAYETCLYLTLKADGILSPSSSEWTILLFFKNLSVIPLTVVFNAVFVLWLTNKMQTQITQN